MKDKLQISVSGIRGIYPESLTSDVVFTFGVVFGSYVKTKKVFVSRDTRVSGDSLKNSMITGLLCTGKDVVDLGITPTPEMGYIIEKIEPSSGVVITASHNPQEYNGIKFFSDKGVVLNAEEGKKLLDIYHKKSFTVVKNPGFVSSEDYTEQYFNSIYGTIDIERIRKKKFKVVVDVCQGVGALLSRRFLEGMGCEVAVINAEPQGIFSHNPEPLPENLKELSLKVVEEKADIGFAQDPDCDRLAFVCEDGTIPGEELTLVLGIKNILEKSTGKRPVVVNLSTTALVEEVTRRFSVDVYRTKIGEINVVEKMKEVGAVIGGEGNGGVIFPAVHYGRDSFVGMALILEYLAMTGKKVSDETEGLPEFFMFKKKVRISPEQKDYLMEELKIKYSSTEENVSLEDGMKILRKDGWIHIRASGTEPIIRLYVEGKNREMAERYLAEFAALLPS
jgi:phosphomannomutase